MTTERDAAQKQLVTIQIDRGVLEAATKRGLRATAVPDITARARGSLRLVDGTPVVFEADGQTVRRGSDGVAPMTLDEWVAQQAAEAPHLFDGNAGGGAAGNGSGGAGGTLKNPFRKETWNLTEQMRLTKQDPVLAARLKAAVVNAECGETLPHGERTSNRRTDLWAKTAVADIIIPAQFEAYALERTAALSAFGQAGIVAHDPAFDELAAGGGQTVNMPFWQDINPTRQLLSDSAALSVNKITSGNDIARIQNDAQVWSANHLAKVISGDDPMAAIGSLVGEYWARVDQALIISCLKGLFGAASMAGNLTNIAVEAIADYTDATKLNGLTFIDATAKLGDRADRLTAVAMHSATEAALRKLDLIDFIPDSEGKEQIRTFQGRRVVVDDSLAPRAGTTNGLGLHDLPVRPGCVCQGRGAAVFGSAARRPGHRGRGDCARRAGERHAAHQPAPLHPASAGREVHQRSGRGGQPDQCGAGERGQLGARVRAQERPHRGDSTQQLMQGLYPIIRRRRVPLTVRHAAPVNVPERTVTTQAKDAPGGGPVEVLPGSVAPSVPPSSEPPAAPAAVSVKAALTRAARKKTPCATPATSSANGS